jgi:ADP-ribose pyrophosphatase YjhB (NUDIX family)/GNAT superfamily N-acetyltransferase
MPTPDFVLSLRERVGHDLLWLPGVTAVVRNDRGEVLLARRADLGQWALVSGILEPGEQPAAGVLREIEEETGVVAELESLNAVWTLPPLTYPNGDRAQYLDLCFTARHVSGEARVNDDESTEVGWFALDALPDDLMERSRTRLERALAQDGSAWFEGRLGDDSPSTAPALASLRAADRVVVLRRATRADLAAVVGLIADDQLGATREDPGDLTAYERAFAAIDADPAQLLVVLDDDGAVVGTMQLTTIPGLSRGGSTRLQVEAVRVASSHRGHGLGEQMLRWAVGWAVDQGCSLVQLTTDKSRGDAHRFYERLGFAATHEGFKMVLTDTTSGLTREKR